MPRSVETVVYELEELPESAKESARAWFRGTCLEHEWYDFVFEDFETICRILGVTLRTSSVRLFGGGTREKPHLFFRGYADNGEMPRSPLKSLISRAAANALSAYSTHGVYLPTTAPILLRQLTAPKAISMKHGEPSSHRTYVALPVMLPCMRV